MVSWFWSILLWKYWTLILNRKYSKIQTNLKSNQSKRIFVYTNIRVLTEAYKYKNDSFSLKEFNELS